MKELVLNIFMNGLHIGILEKRKKGTLYFSYTPSWLKTPGARPLSLSLPLIDHLYSGDVVYNFFDNLLPDNDQIRKRIQAKYGLLSSHPFDILEKIGSDCVGAIQMTPSNEPEFSHTIKSKPLNEKKIAEILHGYQTNPLGMSDDFEDFRISIAGAQEKTAFLYHNKKWHIPISGTPTSHIFKLPIGIIPYQQLDLNDSCENEWFCYQIAKAFDFEVAECHVEFFEDVKVLVVKRFDRKYSSDKSWLMRLPQEDMCQALGFSSHLKYQAEGGPGISEIMKLLLGSHNPEQDRKTFFRTQILFWLLCAIDGHAKNFSIFIEPEGQYRLTPLYDIMSAYPLIKKKQLSERKIKMAMALRGKNVHYKWYEAKRSHFIESAQKSGYSSKLAEQMLDEMLEQVDGAIEKVSSLIPASFPEIIASSIFEGMQKMKIHLSV